VSKGDHPADDSASDSPTPPQVDLKDPVLAAFLAWLIPGLGHFYQGRIAKGILYSVCILGTFVYGVYLGGNSTLGWGRVVYASWRPDDKRISYFAQVCVGLPALPALVQANRVSHGRDPLANGFMAPPALEDDSHDPLDLVPPYTLNTLNKRLNRFFELGTVYTLVAGLLNILAIYDAWGGPVFPETKEKPEDETDDSAAESPKGDPSNA
jgi:hypothetical protein